MSFLLSGHIEPFQLPQRLLESGKCLDSFATRHRRQVNEQEPVRCWLCRETEAESVPTLKGHESEPQAVSETVSNVCAVLAFDV